MCMYAYPIDNIHCLQELSLFKGRILNLVSQLNITLRMYCCMQMTSSVFQALDIIDKVGDRLSLKYSRMKAPNFSEADEDFICR